jgi:Fe-S cluster biogenesis protein NfuA
MAGGTSTRLVSAVRGVIDSDIRPFLKIHGGDVDLVNVTCGGEVHLEFQGACRGCALQTVTYAIAIRQRLLEVPGVTEVAMKGIRISRMALERTAAAYKGYSFMAGKRHS